MIQQLLSALGCSKGAQSPRKMPEEPHNIESDACEQHDPDTEAVMEEQTVEEAPPANVEVADDETMALTEFLQALLNSLQAIENIHAQNKQHTEAVAERLSELSDAISGHTVSEEAFRAASVQSRIEEHAKLQETILSPIFADLINLHDGLLTLRDMLGMPSSESAAQFLDAVAADLDEMMIRYGLVPIPEPVGVLDPKCHRIVGIESVVTPKDGEITKVEKGGFTAFGRVVRPTSVVVKKVV